MKIRSKNSKGESRELLLKEYFLNAYLLAMFKKISDEIRHQTSGEATPALAPVPARVKH